MSVGIVFGASAGIGAAIAKEIAGLDRECPDEMWLVARRAGKLEEVAAGMDHDNVRIVPGDVCDTEFLAELSEKIKKENKILSWVAIAPGIGNYGEFEALSHSDVMTCAELNVTAFVNILHEMLPFMGRNSHVITLASGGAFFSQPGFALYGATKSFALNLSKAVGCEVRSRRIYVTSVCPGPCDTEFLDNATNGNGIPMYKRKFLTSPANVASKAVRAAIRKNKVCLPTFSMKLLYAFRGIIPENLVMRMAKSKNKIEKPLQKTLDKN